jgi:hypothetical protein
MSITLLGIGIGSRCFPIGKPGCLASQARQIPVTYMERSAGLIRYVQALRGKAWCQGDGSDAVATGVNKTLTRFVSRAHGSWWHTSLAVRYGCRAKEYRFPLCVEGGLFYFRRVTRQIPEIKTLYVQV